MRGELTMAKYLITIALTTTLRREVEADSAEAAEQLSDTIYQEYLQDQNTDVVSTEQHRTIELVSDTEARRWQPVGT
jgi:hypothetical protein